jgi:catechol 2,3-dioxygenase
MGVAIELPTPDPQPGFDVTRMSHIVLTARDLDRSRVFYEQVMGMVLTHADDDALYFRGIEEACHHSLVLRRSTDEQPSCQRIGLRMYTEADLERAHAFFQAQGCASAWVEVPFQGPTLHVTDPVGTLLEFCARMPVVERQITHFDRHRGGCAQRIDHCQLFTTDVPRAMEFYAAMGFRLSEYITSEAVGLSGIFLQRKGNPHDLVYFHGPGPQLHHVAFFAPEAQQLLKACDVASSLGFGHRVERGPGRHGPGHAMFVYFRDPDGHRVELFNTHYQVMDIENEPIHWDAADPNVSFPWGLPAQRRWFEETTPFTGVPVEPSVPMPSPRTLERYLDELP